MFERIFRLRENQTDIRTEVIAGLSTFLTMAYIIVVQPAMLSGRMAGFDSGMDFNAVLVATCLSAAAATVFMGLFARYPIALASGMGANAFFTYTLLGAAGAAVATHGWETTGWQVALGVIFWSGAIFFLLSLLGVREMLLNAVSPSLKNGIAVGIGLFIAFIGLKNAGLIMADPATLVTMHHDLRSPDLIVFFFGLFLTAGLHARGIRGAILWGIIAATLLSLGLRWMIPLLPESLGQMKIVANSQLMTFFQPATEVFAMPPSVEPTAFKMDLRHSIQPVMLQFVLVFLFIDLFDTMGTLIGVSEQAGFIKDNKLPRAGRAFMADAVGTVLGASLGTSTVTSYIESAAGVDEGGRTGLTALVVAGMFIVALFFEPVIAMVGSYPAITAPALVIVGTMMIQNVVGITWGDFTEALPAFLIIVGIPLTFSVGDGLALGFIAYPLVKLLAGRGKEAGWTMWGLAAVLVAYFIFVRAKLGG